MLASILKMFWILWKAVKRKYMCISNIIMMPFSTQIITQFCALLYILSLIFNGYSWSPAHFCTLESITNQYKFTDYTSCFLQTPGQLWRADNIKMKQSISFWCQLSCHSLVDWCSVVFQPRVLFVQVLVFSDFPYLKEYQQQSDPRNHTGPQCTLCSKLK